MVRNRTKEKVCLVCWSITGGGGFRGKNNKYGIKLDEGLLNQFRKEKKDKECDLFGKILNKLIDLEKGDGRVTDGSGVSVCSNCKTLVSSAIESKCKTLEVGDRVEKLQQSILEELKELQLYLDIFYLQMKKIENVMGKNDVADLSGLIPGESSGGGLKDELLHFRDSLAKVMTDFRFYRDNVKKPMPTVAQEGTQKLSISPSSSSSLNDAPTTAASQNGHGPGPYLLTLAPLNGTTSILNNKTENNIADERKTSSPSTVIDLSSHDDMSDMDISPSSTLTQSKEPQKMASKPMQVNKDSSDASVDNKSKTDSKQPKRKLSEDVDKDSGSDSEDYDGIKRRGRKPKKSKVIREETKAVSPSSTTSAETIQKLNKDKEKILPVKQNDVPIGPRVSSGRNSSPTLHSPDPTTIESGIQTGMSNEEKTEITSSESGKTAQSVLKNGEKSPTHQQNVPPDAQGETNGDGSKSQQNDEIYSCGVCHVQHPSEKEHMQHMEQHWTDDSQSDTELGQEKDLRFVLVTPTPPSPHKNAEDIGSKQSLQAPPKDIAEEEIPTVPGGESVTTVACTSTSLTNSPVSNGSGDRKNNGVNGEATSDSPTSQSVEKSDTTNLYLSHDLDF